MDDDEDADIMTMMSILKEMKEEEHVLIFKGSIKGRVVVARDRIKDAQDLYNDYFKPDRVFHEGFFDLCSG